MKLSDIAVEVKNKAEKFAALTLLSQASGKNISENSKDYCLNPRHDENSFGGRFVYIDDDSVNAGGYVWNGIKLIQFSELPQTILDSLKPIIVSVKLNETYTAIVSKENIEVGCTKFPISV